MDVFVRLYCGSVEDYLDVLKVYASSITQKAEDIEQSLEQGGY